MSEEEKDQTLDENKLIAQRRAKLKALRKKGNAYPNVFKRDGYAKDLDRKSVV